MNTELPAEIEFIANTVRPEPDTDRIEALAAGGIEWENVVREAVKRHRVGPLLYYNLVESGSVNLVPERFLERLRQCSRQTATRNLSLMNSLLSILNRFREHGIPALPYKGPILSEAIYGDFSLRPSRDLDILVRPGDLSTAESILRKEGFEPERELTGKQKQLLANKHRHRTMKNDGLIVELHPRVSSPNPPFDVAALLDRAGSLEFAGEFLPVIKPMENLFVLSVHGTRHRWNQLKWICDIAYLIHSENFDWPVVLEEAGRRNCYRRVLLGCGLASAILEVELPEIVYSEVRDNVERLVWDTHPDCLLGIDDATSLRYRLRVRDTPFARLQYLWYKLAIPQVRVMRKLPVPEQSFGLSYLLHPPYVFGEKSALIIKALFAKLRKLIRERT